MFQKTYYYRFLIFNQQINPPTSGVNVHETIKNPIQNLIEDSIGKPNEKPVMMELYTVFETIYFHEQS